MGLTRLIIGGYRAWVFGTNTEVSKLFILSVLTVIVDELIMGVNYCFDVLSYVYMCLYVLLLLKLRHIF